MSTARGRVLIATLGLVWAGALTAQPVYKWVDAQGQTHYSSQLPPQQAESSQLKVSPNGSSGAGAGRFGESRELRNLQIAAAGGALGCDLGWRPASRRGA